MRSFKITRALWLSALAAPAVLAAPAALAEDYCSGDVKQFCADIAPGSGRLLECLNQHRDSLSAPCRSQLAASALKARKFVQSFSKSCRSDMHEFCAGIQPGSGRIIECLDEHQTELSQSCRTDVNWVTEARMNVVAVRQACKSDAERLCSDVPPHAGPLLECLQAHESQLSRDCNAANIRQAGAAAQVVDIVEEMTREDRVKEALEILQGIDSVAFSRSQILFQFDSYQDLGGKGNSQRFLFNPQFVFGGRQEFAFQLKVPVQTLYPNASGAQPHAGVGVITTAFAWAPYLHGQIGQYLSLALQWPAASDPVLGGSWALAPSYALALGLARWVSLTAQITWIHSFDNGSYPKIDLLLPEPILVFNLPGRSFLALDTKLGINLIDGSFIPVMKGVAGIYLDTQKSVSVSGWYQASLTSAAVSQSFKYAVGVGLAYFYDW